MRPDVPSPDGGSSPNSRPALRIFTAVLVVALIVFIVLLARDDKRHGGIGRDCYLALVKAIREHEGFEPKDLSLKQDPAANTNRGDQYSGQVTKPDGHQLPITVWIQDASTSQGRGYWLQYRVTNPDGAPGPVVTPPFVEADK